MRTRSTVIPLSMLFSAILASMVVLTSTVGADSKDVTFADPVTIGSIMLKPGTYTLVWTGTGPDVQVIFMKGSKTLGTAPARLVLEKSRNSRTIETKTMPDNSTALLRISFRNKTLLFDLRAERANRKNVKESAAGELANKERRQNLAQSQSGPGADF